MVFTKKQEVKGGKDSHMNDKKKHAKEEKKEHKHPKMK